jgi:hypothetical protein
MSNKKITDLPVLATFADDDVLPIVDVSANVTKQSYIQDLATRFSQGLQSTLISGTNIKTINSTSLLGSGDISIDANPSGSAGSIQFSDGSAFASDSNLFWDNTNKRLGVGTNTPTASIQATTFRSSSINDNGSVLQLLPSYNTYTLSKVSIGAGDFPAQLGIKGYGSTSATTSLLVQNSAGTELFKVTDDGIALMRRINYGSSASEGQLRFGDSFLVYNTSGTASLSSSSAGFEVQSTTKGFLPPRMTTTQKNAISSPASGLMVYDTDTNKLCCYNGTSWNDLF